MRARSAATASSAVRSRCRDSSTVRRRRASRAAARDRSRNPANAKLPSTPTRNTAAVRPRTGSSVTSTVAVATTPTAPRSSSRPDERAASWKVIAHMTGTMTPQVTSGPVSSWVARVRTAAASAAVAGARRNARRVATASDTRTAAQGPPKFVGSRTSITPAGSSTMVRTRLAAPMAASQRGWWAATDRTRCRGVGREEAAGVGGATGWRVMVMSPSLRRLSTQRAGDAPNRCGTAPRVR